MTPELLSYRAEIEAHATALREHYADAPWRPKAGDNVKCFDLHEARPTLAQLTRPRTRWQRLFAPAVAMVLP